MLLLIESVISRRLTRRSLLTRGCPQDAEMPIQPIYANPVSNIFHQLQGAIPPPSNLNGRLQILKEKTLSTAVSEPSSFLVV